MFQEQGSGTTEFLHVDEGMSEWAKIPVAGCWGVPCDLCSKMRSSVVAMRGLGRWPRQNAPDPTGAKRLLLLISQSRAER